MKYKLMSLIVIMMGVSSLSAREVSCKVKSSGGTCGSGVTILNINFQEKTFKLRNGDVMCWGYDHLISGVITENKEVPQAYTSKYYSLIGDKVHNLSFRGITQKINPINFAELKYTEDYKSKEILVYLEYRKEIPEVSRPRVKSTYLECKVLKD